MQGDSEAVREFIEKNQSFQDSLWWISGGEI